MTSDNAVDYSDRQVLAGVDTDSLRHELTQAIGLTARAIARVAVIWDELARRGEDMSGYKFALADYMSRVARGTLLPEMVAQLAGRSRTLALVADMPIGEQQRLVSGTPITIVSQDGIAEKRLADMTWTEAARVIRDGFILTPEEQRIALSRMQRIRKKTSVGRPVIVTINTGDGTMRVGKNSVPLERVLAALRSSGVLV